MVVAAGNDILFAKLADALGQRALAADPRFTSNELRTRHHAELKVEIERLLASQPAEHWLAKLDAAGVPSGPINNVAQILADPQIAARNMVVTSTDAIAGPIKMAGNPIKISGFDDPPTRAPAPELDENRAGILANLDG
jgi:CoA:oxalate CoA-transferase